MDLRDGGTRYSSFAPTSFVAGRPGQVLTIHAAIEASGDRDPDAVYVSFYASRDTQITGSDYYLGQAGIGLSANTWTMITLECTLPVNIPAGTYYVGWIIDPDNTNDETNETNNTAFNESSMLTVAGASTPVVYVDVNARGTGDGSSWENAFHSLQDALAGAQSRAVRVAGGIYAPDRGAGVKRGDREATFRLKSGVAILGGYAGAGEPDPDARDIGIWPTILSGDLNGDDRPVADPYALWLEPSRLDNSRHVVTAIDADRTAILDGVQITGGCADGWFEAAGRPEDSRGGGMYITEGGPRLRRCVFSGNWASTAGGAIYAADSDPELSYCTFCQNIVSSGAQDSRGAGGAVFATGGNLSLTGCTLNGNFSSGNGGALAFGAAGTLSATNCCLHANYAKVRAGAIYALDSRVVTASCTLAGNRQDGISGMIVCDSSGDQSGSELRVTNCILWNGGREIVRTWDLSVTVDHSDIKGGWPGTGNLDADPMFEDPEGPDGLAGTEDDDLRLSRESPCIDAGDTTALPRDVADLDEDGNAAEPVPFDRDGKDRTTGLSVDIGAYETSPFDASIESGQ